MVNFNLLKSLFENYVNIVVLYFNYHQDKLSFWFLMTRIKEVRKRYMQTKALKVDDYTDNNHKIYGCES